MHTYIALLRGINVSGQKKIKMAELRQQLAELNIGNIATYIQSGNIVFTSAETNASALEEAIHQLIVKHYGFEVPVLVLTPQQLQQAIAAHPWPGDELRTTKSYFTFLFETPTPEGIAALEAFDLGDDEWVLKGTTLYAYFPNGAGRSKMSNNLVERKLKVTATARNWNTVHKLVAMAEELG